jgi:type VI secretion system protein ImpG
MIKGYYQRELNRLRELATEFSRSHPALAPMLSGPSQDPDVERLLEGTAFLSGLIHQKLDDDFPEVIQGLMRMIFPHYLQPIPSTTIVTFSPQPGLTKDLHIPKGCALASVPVEETNCIFRTCFDVRVQPIRIAGATMKQQPGKPSVLTIRFELIGVQLNNWQPSTIRLHFGGSYPEAASLWNLFYRHVDRLTVSAGQGSKLNLSRECLKPVGLDTTEALFPYPSHAFPGYRVVQEYFALPEKFLFIDITGLQAWTNRGEREEFEIAFVFEDLPPNLPTIKKESFVLFATPAINLFNFDADPIVLDNRQTEYPVVPSGTTRNHYQVYSVNRVTGYAGGTTRRREYGAFELFAQRDPDVPLYTIHQRVSVTDQRPDVMLSVVYPPGAKVVPKETLSIELLCTNASLPINLQYGDICQPTSTSPNMCTFKNIRVPTAPIQPPLGHNLLWRFLSHVSLNLMTLANAENIKTLLRLYLFPETRDRSEILANERRIEGITNLTTKIGNRLIAGINMRGQEFNLHINANHFASRGDVVLFGMIMDYFLGTYASINSFTHLKVRDSVRGEIIEWKARLGDRPLI